MGEELCLSTRFRVLVQQENAALPQQRHFGEGMTSQAAGFVLGVKYANHVGTQQLEEWDRELSLVGNDHHSLHQELPPRG